ncbi:MULTISPECIES: transglycosylase SLT domain-containing protein [unclassified Streptomyces]|uniref:transglycosylase SLT domain-containing protein n=1 Tax=unclassified Streptomyces TaxID=2593676 RepID=UPI0008851297|nr:MULTISPECIES: transglycosylase SLT domain-containing protein [unclassified Streptomyces]PBC81657.1 transglycosylase-like protein with SLT domain [Streptomyces sp. 2321.6]SDR53756.1 Transglycosylase SLT domain-containing protein [Streptomyces sp. KS_16]SEC24888.1 Transglycosylase SLT domain-containing protein [Streptomyces sp. 2133.1]SEF06132.1 Transglycosylase SLT domain-containing protein [Streptomyces sp. 2112.3]SNC66111.1 Transglycosylase SLT domain-containing protein [Streptomyces sp. 2
MPQHATSGLRRLTRMQKLSVAGVATAGAAALVFTTVPGTDADQGAAQATTVENVKPVAFSAVGTAAKAQQATIAQQANSSAAKGQAEAAAKKAAAVKAAKAKAAAVAKAQAEKARATKAAASRSAVRTAIPAAAKPAVKPVAAKTAAKPAAKTYPDNLDGWIRESLAIMAKKGIPGSYEGIHRNIMRESSGNPMAINNWDINAINGTPSKGLLQVIAPTFKAYHVEGTSWNLYDPVANITAACNYAAAKYGSMDNVNSAY